MADVEWLYDKTNGDIDELRNNFSAYFPYLAKDMTSCFVKKEDRETLRVTLNDGTMFDYHNQLRAVRPVRQKPFEDLTDEECRKEFGYNLLRMMSSRGLTQSMVGERTGLSQSIISRYIYGKANPTLLNITKIARVIGCKVSDLIQT